MRAAINPDVEFHPSPGDRVLACREFSKEFEPAIVISRWPISSEYYEIRYESDGKTLLVKPYRMRPIAELSASTYSQSSHPSPLAVESAQ